MLFARLGVCVALRAFTWHRGIDWNQPGQITEDRTATVPSATKTTVHFCKPQPAGQKLPQKICTKHVQLSTGRLG
jgi:hypothetical protein